MATFKIKIKDIESAKKNIHEILATTDGVYNSVDIKLPLGQQWSQQILTDIDDPKLWSGLNQPNTTEYHINARSSVPLGLVLANFYIIASKLPPKPIAVYMDEEREKIIAKLFAAEQVEEVSADLRMKNYDFGASSDGCAQIIFDSGDFQSAIDTLLISLSDSVYQPWRINSVYVQESLKERLMAFLTDERLEKSVGGYAPSGDIVKRSRLVHIEVIKRYGCEMRAKIDGSATIMFDVQPIDVHGWYESDQIKPITITFFRTIADAATLLNNNAASSTPSSLSIWTEEIATLYTFLSKVNTDTNLIWCNTISMVYDDLFERSATGIQPSHKIDQNRKVVASCYDQNGKPRCLYVVFGK